jgi:hypothetical protein
MEFGPNFEWTGVNWTWEYFLNNLGLSFKILKIMMRRLVMEQQDLIRMA